MGINSGFEDVMVLDAALEQCKDDVPSALQTYSNMRGKEAEALVSLSRGLDGGFFSFVLPLIIDGVFHKILPKIFGPNTIAMLQIPTMKFTQIQKKKRIDRLMQLTSLFLFLWGLKSIGQAVLTAALSSFNFMKRSRLL